MRSRRLLALWVLLALLAAAGLAALGVWQLQRLQWKQALIAQVEARLAADPVALPPSAQWAGLGAEDAYRRVRLSGRWDPARETLVATTTELGPGYWALVPLRTPDGAWVWVNRGFVPEDRKAEPRPLPPEGELRGLLRLSEPEGRPLRRNDPAAGRWYSRDVAALSAQHTLAGPVLPLFVDEAAEVASSQRWPRPGLTVLRFPNSHLSYAITWFILAGMALAAAGLLVWDDRRHHDDDHA